jgi:hypothetical protein
MGYKGKIEKLHENKGNNPTRKDLVALLETLMKILFQQTK